MQKKCQSSHSYNLYVACDTWTALHHLLLLPQQYVARFTLIYLFIYFCYVYSVFPYIFLFVVWMFGVVIGSVDYLYGLVFHIKFRIFITLMPICTIGACVWVSVECQQFVVAIVSCFLFWFCFFFKSPGLFRCIFYRTNSLLLPNTVSLVWCCGFCGHSFFCVTNLISEFFNYLPINTKIEIIITYAVNDRTYFHYLYLLQCNQNVHQTHRSVYIKFARKSVLLPPPLPPPPVFIYHSFIAQQFQILSLQ